MKLLFSLKSLGKKHPYLKDASIELDIESTLTLEQFLKILVYQQVEEFNLKVSKTGLIQFLNEDSIDEKIKSGKIGFGEIHNPKLAEKSSAIQSVLQAFEDGLIAVFIGNTQIESLGTSIQLKESETISIIKLSFLSGSIW